MAPYSPTLGAWPSQHEMHFAVWAPEAQHVEVVLGKATNQAPVLALKKDDRGFFHGAFSDIRPGALYRYRVDGKGPFPDPASRYQPEGVHGPSQIIDPSRFAWSDQDWKGIHLDNLVIYELHVGTFSPEGTFAGVQTRLPYLKDLGINTIELMPLNDFPGQRNWGYDGVSLFAPARCYGTPDDLRRLVDAAHHLGLGIIVDVVYNHLGPDGNYLGVYSPYYFTQKHQSPWGAGVNLDDQHADQVRHFFIENVLHWIHEYHADGLRLDATHAMVDDSRRHFLAQLTDTVRSSITGRGIVLIAEDCRNLAHMVKPEKEGGWGLDGVWADDFHHEVRRCLAGDHEGYYGDYTGTVQDIATALQKGWVYCGQFAPHFNGPRGTDPTGLQPEHLVFFLQNHDQVGNRAMGERLNQQIDPAAYRAATVLFLCAPQTPMLFMGQEWATSSPFLFFTDHKPDLGRLVTEGRRAEFKSFSAFSNPETRAHIPDPQALATFEKSRLHWEEKDRPPHAAILHLYRRLLHLRQSEPALRDYAQPHEAIALSDSALLLIRHSRENPLKVLLVVVQLKRGSTIDLRSCLEECRLPLHPWQILLTTEQKDYCSDPAPLEVDAHHKAPVLRFSRPGAVLLRPH